jgi:transcriptional regulator with XRE-family HTH domain
MSEASRPPHFERIAALRRERGETLEAFGLAIGVASKGRISELERGLRTATPEQALAIERISGGQIDAADLNEVVAAARQSKEAA